MQALSAAFLFIRCAAIDPTDKTRFRMRRKSTRTAFSNLNYGFVLGQIVVRFLRRIERRVLKTFIRRKYLDPLKSNLHLEPLLTFPLLVKDDLVAQQTKDDDISFCSLCDFEVCSCISRYILLIKFVELTRYMHFLSLSACIHQGEARNLYKGIQLESDSWDLKL